MATSNLVPKIIPATIEDYPTIQNMARFYVYDLSRECGLHYNDWNCPENGLFECDDFKRYFEDPDWKPFLIRINGELAGFVMINKLEVFPESDFNMGEFFILAKFQHHGIGHKVANEIFDTFKGRWSVAAIPKNEKGLRFWRKVIGSYTDGQYSQKDYSREQLITPEHPDAFPMTVLFFDSRLASKSDEPIKIRKADKSDVLCMVQLSYAKRLEYEKAQPQFWKSSGEPGNTLQLKCFDELLKSDEHIVLMAEVKEIVEPMGFIIGQLIKAPAVYDPGGLTLMVDDFCVVNESLWDLVGSGLIKEAKRLARIKGAVQIVIVCGSHDNPKRRFLINRGASIASVWYVEDIPSEN